MAEAATLAAAFDDEVSRGLKALPRRGDAPLSHEHELARWRHCQKLADSVSHYASRLPPSAAVPRILKLGRELRARREPRCALSACYRTVLRLVPQPTADCHDSQACMAARRRVEAIFGAAACGLAVTTGRDPKLLAGASVDRVVDALDRFREGVELAAQWEELYWLVNNGAVHMRAAAGLLVATGFAQRALPFLVFASLALDSNPTFGNAAYLPRRLAACKDVCECCARMGAREEAARFVERFWKKVDELEELYKLDPLPPPKELVESCRNTRAGLAVLRLKYGAEVARNSADLRSLLETHIPADDSRIEALVEAFLERGEGEASRGPIPAEKGPAFDMLWSLAQPLVSKISEALTARTEEEALEGTRGRN
ncbi:unnamed protein product [Ostreobium quekettii]|uniref:Uncharacterized protein n=1 Tax=Ostreobium quekettii TaxID=121088 RepID=A0A8S1JEH0_9CHLO|nr:unnamed protein product [Ostreobium quekettii]